MKKPVFLSRGIATLLAAGLAPTVVPSLSAATWDGGADPIGLWSNGLNWAGDVAPNPNELLDFAGTVDLNTNNDFAAGTGFGGITFDAGAGAFTLGGNGIQLNGDVINLSTNLQTIALPLTYSAPHSFNTSAGDITISGLMTGTAGSQLLKTGTGTLTITSSGTNVLGSNGQGLIQQMGTLRLNGGTGAVYTVTGEAWFGDTTNANTSTIIDSGALNISTWYAQARGNGTGTVSSNVTLNGSASVTTANFSVGYNANNGANTPAGKLTLNGTSVFTVTTTGNQFHLAESAGSSATIQLNDNSTFKHNAGGSTSRIGVLGRGLLNIASPGAAASFNQVHLGVGNNAAGAIWNRGTLSVLSGASTNHFALGQAAGGYGYYLHDTPVGTTLQEVGIGGAGGGSGVMEIRSGTVSIGQWVTMNRTATTGTTNSSMLLLSGGTLAPANIAGRFYLNQSTAGTTEYAIIDVGAGGKIAGSTLSDINLMNSNLSAANTSVLTVHDGGSVAVASIFASNPTGTAVVNLNGGTLKPTANGTLLNQNLDSVVIYPAGATFDTNGFNTTTAANALLAPGGNGLASIALSTPGSGYIGRPVVNISDATGTGATAVANFDEVTGALTGITVTNPGSNYSAPVITLVGGGPLTAGTAGSVALGTNANTGGVTKIGNGTLTMGSAASTYGGPTKISGGTLSIASVSNGGGASTLGASSSAATNLVFDGGTLQYTGGAATTDRNFSITPGKTATFEVTTATTVLTLNGGSAVTTGGLTKIGNGVLSLAGTNLHTGPTSANAGVLSITGAFTGPVVVNGGGRFNAGYQTVGAVTMPTLTLGAGSGLDFDFGVGNDTITVGNAGGLTLGTTALNLYISGSTTPFSTNGTYTLIDYNTSVTGTLTGAFSIANSQVGKIYGISVNPTATTLELTISDAVNTAWNVPGGGSWNLAGNWSAGIPNGIGAIATFGSAITTPSIVTVDGAKTAGTIIFDNPNGYTISGGGSDTITLNNGFGTPQIGQLSGSHILAAPLVLSQGTNVNVAGGTVLTMSGNISGPGNLNLAGLGSVVLSGNNTYTGATSVGTNLLEITGSGSLAGSVSITLKNGSIFRIGTAASVTLPQPVTLDLAGGTVTGISGAASGSGNFNVEVVTGTAATIAGAVSNAGGSLLKRGGGTLKIANGGASVLASSGGIALAVEEGSLTLDGGAAATYAVTGGELTVGDNTPAAANVTLASGTLNVGTFTSIGRGNGTSAIQSSLNVTGGTLNTQNFFMGYANGVGGYNAMPVANLSGSGILNATSTGANLGVRLGESAGGTSTVNLSDNATLTSNGDFQVGFGGIGIINVTGNATVNVPQLGLGYGNNVVGNTGIGVIRQTGGIVQQAGGFGGDWRIGGFTGANDAQAYGYYSISNGTLNSGGRNFQIGANGLGVLDISGGTVISASGFPVVGRFVGSSGALNVSSGSFTSNGAGNLLIIGEQGKGVLNVSGTGSVVVAGGPAGAGAGGGTGALRLGHTLTGNGTLNLNGGTVTTNGIAESTADNTAISYLYLNGGTIKASAANATFLQGLDNAIVGPGGAIFDTNGNDITVAQSLSTSATQGVKTFPVLSGGSGYLGRPVVQISGDGFGATANAVVDASGTVTGITITNPGYGYTNPPTATLQGGSPTIPALLDVGTLAVNLTTGGLTKKGNGVLTLLGSNTYGGPTVVQAGTLTLQGSISGSLFDVQAGATFDVNGANFFSGFTLANGQTLQGTGTVLGATTSVGTISPGASSAAGKLNTGNVFFNGGTFAVDLTSASSYDQLNVAGFVGLTDNTALSITLGYSPAPNTKFTLILNDDVDGILGTSLFTNNGTPILDDATFIAGGQQYQLDYNGGDGNDVVLTAVPEPGSVLLLLAGLGLAGVRRRRADTSRTTLV